MLQDIRIPNHTLWTIIYIGYGDNPLMYKRYKIIYLGVVKS